jgi:hypothetical protein
MSTNSKSLWFPRGCIGGLILAAALFGGGCATKRLPDYQSGTAMATALTVRDAGVEVSLDPFVESERTRKYFGIHASEEGIGVVFVRVSNGAPDRTYLVEKKNFQLIPAGAASGQDAGATSIRRGTAGGEATAMVGAAVSGLGGLGLMFGGSSMVAHATEVQRNFVGKEMPNQTLAPGRTMEGFVYFQPLPKNGWNRGATMKINLTDTKSHEPVLMTVPLSD